MQAIAQPLTHQILFTENGFTAEMCIERQSLELAFRLRYKAYLEAGAIKPNAKQQFTDPYDQQTNARTYLIWFEGCPVASIRSLTWSAGYNWQSTPSIKFFETDVDQQLGLRSYIMECNRFVVDPGFTGRKSLRAHLMLFKVQALAAMIDQCDHVITAVRPRHASFYERMMNFQIISEPISVPEVSFQILLLTTPIASTEKLASSSKNKSAFNDAELNRFKNCLQHLND